MHGGRGKGRRKRGQVQFRGCGQRLGGRRLTRSAGRAKRGLESELFGRGRGPRRASIRNAALHASPQGLQLCFGLRGVDVLARTAWVGNGPTRKPCPLLGRSLLANPKASPSPIDGGAHQGGPQGVAFDIPQHLVKMAVCLDGERLEPSLINVAIAQPTLDPHPTRGVRHREPNMGSEPLVFLRAARRATNIPTRCWSTTRTDDG